MLALAIVRLKSFLEIFDEGRSYPKDRGSDGVPECAGSDDQGDGWDACMMEELRVWGSLENEEAELRRQTP